jgi:hypothetical protein
MLPRNVSAMAWYWTDDELECTIPRRFGAQQMVQTLTNFHKAFATLVQINPLFDGRRPSHLVSELSCDVMTAASCDAMTATCGQVRQKSETKLNHHLHACKSACDRSAPVDRLLRGACDRSAPVDTLLKGACDRSAPFKGY